MIDACKKAASVALLSLALFPASLLAQTNDEWNFGLSIYGWFPDISGETSFTPPQGDGDFTIGIDKILDNLKFTFQGSFDMQKGNWGVFTDVIYMDVDASRSQIEEGTIGGSEIPYDLTGTVKFDMKSLIWTTAAYYRLVNDQDKSVDFLFGARYLDVEQTLDFSLSGDVGNQPLPEYEGRASVTNDSWDALIGVRGRFGLGQGGSWFIPYYLDVGTGNSDLTWQAVAGLGYSFSWGELAAVWRYLDYDLSKGKPVADVNFNGPAVGAVFRW